MISKNAPSTSPELENVLSEIEKIKGKPVIVEGKNDRKSLELLGFQEIIELDSPLYQVVEEFEGEEIVILTDLDKEGKKLFGKLYKDFCRRGIRVDTRIRELLFQTKVRQIEGLANHIQREGM